MLCMRDNPCVLCVCGGGGVVGMWGCVHMKDMHVHVATYTALSLSLCVCMCVTVYSMCYCIMRSLFDGHVPIPFHVLLIISAAIDYTSGRVTSMRCCSEAHQRWASLLVVRFNSCLLVDVLTSTPNNYHYHIQLPPPSWQCNLVTTTTTYIHTL